VNRPHVRILGAVMAIVFVFSHGAHAQQASAADAFADGAWHLELSSQAFSELWNYNLSREELYGLSTGLTYGAREGIALFLSTPVFYVSQRTADALAIGLTGGARWRIARRGRAAGFLELTLGVAHAETPVPPRGTRFNYVFQPGAGVTVGVRGRAHVMAGIRWLHLSNAGHGGRDRNPDIQAVGLHAGVLLPF
jgi:hypothetical protein